MKLIKWQKTSGPWEYAPDDVITGRIKGGAAEVRLAGGFLLKVRFPGKYLAQRLRRKFKQGDALVQFAASGKAELTESELLDVVRYIHEAKEKLIERRIY